MSHTTEDHTPTRALSPSIASVLLGIVIPAATVLVGLVTFLTSRDRLPDPLATHFDGSGTPDGSMSHAGFLIVMGVMAGIGVALCVAVALRKLPAGTALTPTVAFLGGFLPALASGIVVTTALSQRDLPDWHEAGSPGWSIVVLIPLSLGVGGLTAWLGSILTPVVRSDADVAPTMDLGGSELAVWTSTASSRSLAVAASALAVSGITIALFGLRWLIIPTAAVTIACLALTSIHVRADRTGLHIGYGILPWPRTTIDIERIERVSVIDARPSEWGGWGYRGSLTLMRQAAVFLRAGPALRLDLADGKTFVVTVDDPEPGAALLNAEVSRRGSDVGVS